MTRPRPCDADNPAVVYRDSLSHGSYWAVHHSLETIVSVLGGGDPWRYSWHQLRYRDTARVRAQLVSRYAPATVNKMLTVLRGVLKTCWRLGLMDAETYQRAADVANVRARTLPAGRGVERDEVGALLSACAADTSAAGRRDAAVIAILYAAGLRRAELCGLDLDDLDPDGCALTVRAGKGRQDRRVFLARGACELVGEWIEARGSEHGPLFCPVGAGGEVRATRLRGESVHYVLKKRQREAGLDRITPHDFRRGYVSGLLAAGVDVFTVQTLVVTPMPSPPRGMIEEARRDGRRRPISWRSRCVADERGIRMGFDGLLAFLGIGVAIFAIADPVTRRAIRLFIDKRTLYGGFLLAFILIFSAKLLHETHPILDILLQGVALLTLVATAQRAWEQYSTAHLSDATAPGLAELFRVALLEKRFSEVERVLRINRGNISRHLTAEGRRHLFDPELVRAMVDARSLIHLELLADEAFLESLENRLSVVDVVVRALVEARHSPIRSAVIRQYGGDEGHIPDPGSVRLFESTFANPSWYLSTRADYPLLMGALEALRSGGLDAAYNSKTEHYAATQGISSRSRCVVNLAEKAHVLALSAAIEGLADGDFYVSDLLNIFSEILDRSQVRPDIWQSPPEAPTPYAWLLKEILADLYSLSRQVLRRCYSEITDPGSEASPMPPWKRIIERRIAPVPRIARDLASVWSFCVLELARADEGNVSAWFRRSWLRWYFDFLLQLRHDPQAAFGATGDQVTGLDEWYNFFAGEFREFLRSSDEELRGRILEAIDALDKGKGWIKNLDAFKRELGILASEAPA